MLYTFNCTVPAFRFLYKTQQQASKAFVHDHQEVASLRNTIHRLDRREEVSADTPWEKTKNASESKTKHGVPTDAGETTQTVCPEKNGGVRGDRH